MDVPLDEQGKVAEQFLVGLLDSFGLSAQIAVSVPDDDTVDIQLTGGDLGLLIGPKGATLLSVQDLTRTVVQRKTSAGNGRIFIDVSGYRQKRNEALTRFAQKVAADVLSSQSRVALEPMSAPDRKTVHDAITGIDGVATVSEGEDALRHVVVVPAGD
jgi:spoIIIJ-associated protein